MKNYFSRIFSIMALGVVLAIGIAQKASAQDITVSYQTFYDNLSPYGQWINDPEYGDVWVPNEGGDFRPYGSRGHWVMTDYGNTWVSDDPWGWAVYHYGRWTYNPYYGWVWIPGYEWAPAWVSWRYGGGYCGWAPLGPGMSVGVSYNYPESWWVFVSPAYMYQPNCIHYWRGPSYNPTYIRQTTIINNYYVDNSTHVRYNYGPRREAIQQVTHQPVQVYRVSQLNRPGAPSVSRNTVSLYRPVVNRNTANTARPANVMQAPKPIGRNPQPANAPGNNRQPAFRQEMQRHMAERGNQPTPARSTEPARQQAQPNNRQPMNQPNRMDNRQAQQREQQMQQQRARETQPNNRQPMNQPSRMDNRQAQQREQQMQQQRAQQAQEQRGQQMQQQRAQQAQQQREQQRNQQMQQQRVQQAQQQREQQAQQQREQQVQQQRAQQQREQQMQQQRAQQMQQQREQQMQQQRMQQMQQQRENRPQQAPQMRPPAQQPMPQQGHPEGPHGGGRR